MRPASSPSDPPPAGSRDRPPAPGGGLFDGVLARGGVRAKVSDRAWLQALLDVEAALARAGARCGLLPADHAEAIAGACRAEHYDAHRIGRDAAASGNPVVPLVRALTERVGGAAAGSVHLGATSQDVSDTAAMLVARRALAPLLDDLDGAAEAAAALARAHRDTPVAGRTLLQQAPPTTFGLKAAAWLTGLDEATDRLQAVRADRLAVQLGGAVGTLATLGEAGLCVLAALATELDLAEPVVGWHTTRTRWVELAAALAGAAGVSGKIARDVVLLAQTEVAEVTEGGGAEHGGSSTLPHKRNPVAAVSAAAAAAQAPGLLATVAAAAAAHEHERAAGAWHAEWLPLAELLRSTGSAAAWLRDCLEHLQVDAERMRRNLELTGGLVLAERVTTALAPALGRLEAHDVVRHACDQAVASGRPLADVLAEVPDVTARLDGASIARLLDPAEALGSAPALVDRALRAHGHRRQERP